jgi:hypothetical protein
MAKKAATSSPKVVAKAAKPIAETEVRNTPIPRKAVAKPAAEPVINPAPAIARREITRDDIARRAYEISCGPECGSELDNWLRAERELRGA